ncbi:hypothetical protein V6N13_033909 [Hibiscus sabdariffa]
MQRGGGAKLFLERSYEYGTDCSIDTLAPVELVPVCVGHVFTDPIRKSVVEIVDFDKKEITGLSQCWNGPQGQANRIGGYVADRRIGVVQFGGCGVLDSDFEDVADEQEVEVQGKKMGFSTVNVHDENQVRIEDGDVWTSHNDGRVLQQADRVAVNAYHVVSNSRVAGPQ